ncbi:MAG: malonate transporter subunit MadL [Pirellulales bacterium]
MIYGTGLLAACLLLGRLAGRCLGQTLGIAGDVGGVGVAMLLLVAATGWLRRMGRLPAATQDGIGFWSGIYIPIVVAMAASLDVRAALSGGLLAAVAGIGVVLACLALVPLLTRFGPRDATGT